MRAMILAAGLGTRLRPLTELLPKPLVPVLNVPNLELIVGHLAAAGIDEIAVNLHHLPEAIPARYGDGRGLGVRLTYSVERPDILGTGGGIARMASFLGEGTCVVINGDALFAPDLGAALAAHRSSGAMATLVVRDHPAARQLGAVESDGAGRVRRLIGRGPGGEGLTARMFTGVHLIEPRLLGFLPVAGCIVRETYAPLIEAGARIHAFVDNGYFCDLGTPERYLGATRELLAGRAALPGLPAPVDGRVLGQDLTVDPSARLGDEVVLGDGVTLGPRADLERVVALPGAVVDATLRDAIVLPDGRIVPAGAPR